MGAIWASRDGASKFHGAGHKFFKLSFDIKVRAKKQHSRRFRNFFKTARPCTTPLQYAPLMGDLVKVVAAESKIKANWSLLHSVVIF
jgi:hypothetical protein